MCPVLMKTGLRSRDILGFSDAKFEGFARGRRKASSSPYVVLSLDREGAVCEMGHSWTVFALMPASVPPPIDCQPEEPGAKFDPGDHEIEPLRAAVTKARYGLAGPLVVEPKAEIVDQDQTAT
jgi:hypothetical protein